MADAATNGDTAAAAPPAPDASPCPVLTPAHPELLQCCLLAGHYRAASRLVTTIPVRTVSANKAACMASAIELKNAGTDVANAPSSTNSGSSKKALANRLPHVNAEAYLRYFYYLGMIRVGCNDLEGAISAFSVCLTVPCRTVSAIIIAARKKMLLCRCLLTDPTSPTDRSSVSLFAEGDDSEAAKRSRTMARQHLLSVPAATSPAVTRYLGNASPSFASSASSSQPHPHVPVGGKPSTSGSSKRSRGAVGDYYDDDVAMAPPDERRRVSLTNESGAGEEPSEGGDQKPAAAERGAGQPDREVFASGEEGATVDSARCMRETESYNLGRYDSLVDAFASGNVKEFREVREAMADILAVDSNAGLAEQVEAGMRARRVHAVAAVYEVVSMATLASDIGFEGRSAEAERVVSDMVATTHFLARIDQESGMVYFMSGAGDDDDDDDSDDEEEHRAELAMQMRQCIELSDRIRSLDADITASERYQQIVARNEANSKAAGQSGESGGKSIADVHGVFE